jgi:hypothetical protein
MSETSVEIKPETPAAEAAAVPQAEAKKPSAAQDLRNIQMLLVSGMFPGNAAPMVVAAYNQLEVMAKKVEEDAAHLEEFNARQAAGK